MTRYGTAGAFLFLAFCSKRPSAGSRTSGFRSRSRNEATQFPTIGLFERNANNFKGTRNTKAQKSWSSRAEPAVRIPFPPADSQSLSRSRFSRSRTPLFRAGLGSWLGDRVSRDAPGSPLRANWRQYLCRPIFQYRSAAEVVSENAAPVPTKLGLLRA